MYGVEPFTVGTIRETDTSKMLSNSPDLIIPELEYSEVTKDLYNTTGAIFVYATKINVNEDGLEDLKVNKVDLAKQVKVLILELTLIINKMEQ